MPSETNDSRSIQTEFLADIPDMLPISGEYASLLIRLWHVPGGEAGIQESSWRSEVEHIQSGGQWEISSLRELERFLESFLRQLGGREWLDNENGEKLMTLEELKNKIRKTGEEAWMKGNIDALAEVYTTEFVGHRPPMPDFKGLEASKEYIADTRLAYSDIQITYEEMVAEGNRIAYRYTWQANHTGISPSLPIPPTGKQIRLTGCVLVHVENGKVVEEFDHSDYLGFLQQLGVVPALG